MHIKITILLQQYIFVIFFHVLLVIVFQEPGQKLSFELKIILSVNCKARFFPYNGYRQQCKRLITTFHRSKIKGERERTEKEVESKMKNSNEEFHLFELNKFIISLFFDASLNKEILITDIVDYYILKDG